MGIKMISQPALLKSTFLSLNPQETEIQVKDKGVGIIKEEQQKIFNNFFRGSEAEKINPQGLGLGTENGETHHDRP